VNPSLTSVSTSDTANDMAMAMIAGTSTDAYVGSARRDVALDCRACSGLEIFDVCRCQHAEVFAGFFTALIPPRGDRPADGSLTSLRGTHAARRKERSARSHRRDTRRHL